jgi:hypothetical protein
VRVRDRNGLKKIIYEKAQVEEKTFHIQGAKMVSSLLDYVILLRNKYARIKPEKAF